MSWRRLITPKQRFLAALKLQEPDRVPTGKNQVDGLLAERVLGRPTLFNTGWKELNALWGGRRDDIVHDCAETHVGLVKVLEWDYVRVPFSPSCWAL